MAYGPAENGSGNSVTTPVVVILPIFPAAHSVNQRLPSGPAQIPVGQLSAVGTGKAVTVPEVVMRLTVLVIVAVNHTFPSGPGVIPCAPPKAVDAGNSERVPVGVI